MYSKLLEYIKMTSKSISKMVKQKKYTSPFEICLTIGRKIIMSNIGKKL